MTLVTRASLPSEFLDITSAKLLKQPEPQYLYAKMWKIALNAALNPAGEIGLPGRAIASDGAGVDPLDASRLMMDDGISSGAIQVIPELGKVPGHTVRLNRPVFANTTYTEASRQIPSGGDISTSAISLSAEQVPVTIKKFAGPYDQVNSRVAPYGVDRFDASLSIHSLADMVGKNLGRDFDKFIENVMVTLLDTASTTVRPLGFSADADFTTAESGPMDFNTISRVERALDEANIPVFPNGRRMLVIDPRQAQSLKDDPQFARYAEFHAPVNPLLAQSYLKSVAGFDIYKSNTLDTDTNASSVVVHKAHAFGPGVLGSAIGEMPRVMPATDDNYGETAKVIWLLYGAFALLDSRFVVSCRTS